jgi:hypothetical protein
MRARRELALADVTSVLTRLVVPIVVRNGVEQGRQSGLTWPVG